MARPTVGCVVVFEFHWVTKGQLPGDVRVFKLKTKKAINKHVERNALHHLPFFTWFQSWIITRNTNLKKHDKNELELLLRGVSLNSGWVLMYIFTSNPDPHPPNPGQATGPVCPSIRQVHCWVSRSQTLAPQRSTRHFCFPEKNWPGKKHDVVYGGSLIHQLVLDLEELIYDQPTWNCLVNFDRDSLLSPPLWSWMARSTACVKNEFVQAGKSRTSSHNSQPYWTNWLEMWTKLPPSRGCLMVYPIGWTDTLLCAVIILNSGMQQCLGGRILFENKQLGEWRLVFAKRSYVAFFESKWALMLPSSNLSRSLYAILSNLQPGKNTETHAEGHRMVWSWPALIATWLFQSAATAHLTGWVRVPKNVLGQVPRIQCV